jgi:hypothetical protein
MVGISDKKDKSRVVKKIFENKLKRTKKGKKAKIEVFEGCGKRFENIKSVKMDTKRNGQSRVIISC